MFSRVVKGIDQMPTSQTRASESTEQWKIALDKADAQYRAGKVYASQHVVDTLAGAAAVLRETRTRAEGPLLEYLVERTIQDVAALVEILRFQAAARRRLQQGDRRWT